MPLESVRTLSDDRSGSGAAITYLVLGSLTANKDNPGAGMASGPVERRPSPVPRMPKHFVVSRHEGNLPRPINLIHSAMTQRRMPRECPLTAFGSTAASSAVFKRPVLAISVFCLQADPDSFLSLPGSRSGVERTRNFRRRHRNSVEPST
jgi:hypothetical protein